MRFSSWTLPLYLVAVVQTVCIATASAASYNVSNASQLHSALANAGAGDEIVLAPGNYGAINLEGTTYSGFVTVRSSDPSNPAVMTSLTLTSCRYLEFRNIHVANPTNDGLVGRVETSNYIRLIDSELHGAVDTSFSGPAYGLHLLQSSNVRVEGCYIHDTSMGSYVTGGTNNVLFENTWDRVRGVALTISDLGGLLVENNEFGGHHFPESGTHQDFIKGGGKTNSTNVVIRGNVMIARNRANIQGIFLHGNVEWNNVLIEQNIIYTGMNYGIGITGGSNITVRHNTVLHSRDSGGSASAIIVSGSETVTGNIYTNWQERAGNLVLPLSDLNAEYAKYFENPVTTSLNENYSVYNYIPKPGSAADNPNMGAYQRVYELTGFEGGGETPDPDPIPEPEPDPTTAVHVWIPAAVPNSFGGDMTSGGAYASADTGSLVGALLFPNSTTDNLNCSSSETDMATYTFNVPESGNYYAWGRFFYPGTDNDANSFCVAVDGGASYKFGNNKDYFGQYHWDGDGADETGTPSALPLGNLSAGEHTLTVYKREAAVGTPPRLDVILVTNQSGYAPSDSDVDLDSSTDTPPVITLLGENPVTLSVGETYVDAGATASDAEDGDLTGQIQVNSTVDTGVAGNYRVRYTVSDSSGNAATPVVRDVYVVAEPTDTTPPTITLIGNATVQVSVGDSYTDAGATAFDAVDGDLTAAIRVSSNVNTSVVGQYSVTYNVSDAAGNAAAPVNRTVRVVDDIAPELTLLGNESVTVSVGETYTDAGATATDNVDGDISDQITVTGSVNSANVGVYSLTYNVSDAAGNAAVPVSRTVNVVDDIAPELVLVGDDPVTVSVGDAYTDAGATATDNVDGDLTDQIRVSSNVDTNQVGQYRVIYNVSDAAGNAATPLRRTVNVVDDIAPEITILGDNPATVLVGESYTDAGATANDNVDGDLTAQIQVGNEVNPELAGTYRVTYTVSDAAGNAAEATRKVRVVASSTPEIELLGDNPAEVKVGDDYTDAGATAFDAEDGDLTDQLSVTDDVDTSVVGTYSVTYRVSDSDGNAATPAVRTVHVLANSVPEIALRGDNPVTVAVGETYVDAGATAFDEEDGDLTDQLQVTSTVDTSVPGTYTVTYTVSDSDGNTAEPVVRTVNVAAVALDPVTLYVDGANPENGDGSQANPFSTLRAALDGTADGRGDVVYVAPGSYAESLVLRSGVRVESTEGAYDTILLGDGSNAPVVTLADGTTLSGFTIGYGEETTSVVLPESAAALVRNCVLAHGRNGIVANDFSALSIVNCVFTENTDFGVYLFEGATLPVLANSIFAWNGTGISADSGTEANTRYNGFFANGLDREGVDAAGSDLSGDPMFVDPETANYHLQSTSPYRHAGDPLAAFNDVDGTRNDLGADGGPWGVTDTTSPMAKASVTPPQGPAPLTVMLDAQDSYDEWGIASYEWHGQSSGEKQMLGQGPTVETTFTTPGTYVVTLEVQDHNGLKSTTSTTIVVDGGAPEVTASVTPIAGPAGTKFEFVAEGSDPDGGSLGYAWDLTGDGIVDSRQARVVSHNVGGSAPGSRTAHLEVVDDEGNTVQKRVHYAVTNGPVIASRFVMPETGGLVSDGEQPGASLSIPPDAISEELVASISFVSEVALPPHPRAESNTLSFGPENLTLGQAATVRMELPTTRGPGRPVKISWWDASLADWTDADVSNVQILDRFNMVEFKTHTLGIFSILTLGRPEVNGKDAVIAVPESSGYAEVELVLDLEPDEDAPVTITYSVVPISATENEDYRVDSDIVVVKGGQGPSVIRIPIIDDAVPEGDEEFRVLFTDVDGGTLGDTKEISVQIIDDDELDVPPGCSAAAAGGGGTRNALPELLMLLGVVGVLGFRRRSAAGAGRSAG